MPFGLKNAPSTFQRVMDNILVGIQNERCLVYMDDIIIYSTTLEEHINRLKEIFTRLSQANLKIQPDKCEFLRKEVAYLGHIITKDGVKPNPEKISAVQNFPVPKNPKDIKSFLGLAGYYRRFIPNFAKIVKPLTSLLHKDTEFNFNEQCHEAFNKLKEALTSYPILQYPDFEQEFILTTDASNFAVGSVLSQMKNGKDLPIAYSSRTLSQTESKYSTIQKELLSILVATKTFRPYLYGRKFKLVTDHRPLTWLFSIKDPGSKLARWRLKLEEYDYQIIYKPGKQNTNADALSRIQINYLTQLQTLKIFHNGLQNENLSHSSGSETETSPETISEEYSRYKRLKEQKSLIDYSKCKNSNENFLDKSHKNILTPIMQGSITENQFKIIEDFLDEDYQFRDDKINIQNSKTVKNRKYFIIPTPYENTEQLLFHVIYESKEDLLENSIYYLEETKEIPLLEILSYIFSDDEIEFITCNKEILTPAEDQREIIIDQYHSGKANLHRGINETINRIKQKYNWPNLNKQVEHFIKNCDTCNKTKICRKNLSNPLVITETPKTPFERINLDLLEVPENNIILTIRDELTKFTQAYPLLNKTSKQVVNTLLLYFQHYGTPLRIHCDRGKEFDNQLLKDLCTLYEIKLTYSSVNHPQSNGSLERFHATLLEMIRATLTDNPGDHPLTCLPYAIICYNNSKNQTHGFTPYELIFGHTNSRPPEKTYNQEELISKYVRDLNNKISYFYELARERTIQRKEKAKARYDEMKNPKEKQFNIQDKVFIKESQRKTKLANKSNGPFEIIQILENNALKLRNPVTNKEFTINSDMISSKVE